MLRRPRPPVDAALPVLRRRTSHLLAGQPARFQAFVRALPLLLCTRFRRPSLDTEPPGLARAPRRRRWGKLCERLELPPPSSWYPTRPLVQSLLLVPEAGGFELLIVPVDRLTPHEVTRVSVRVEALRHLANAHAPSIQLRMASAGELTPSLFAWAAVVGGELPTLPADQPFDWFDAFSRAPSPLLRALMLLVPRDAAAPLDSLRDARAYANLLPFVARWSGHPVARDLAALEKKTVSPAELDGLSTALQHACLTALRRFPVRERRGVRETVRGSLFAARVPPVLRDHLVRTLQRCKPREVQTEDGWQLELDGLVLAQAPGLDQLRATAVAEAPDLAHDEPVWRRLAQLLEQPRPRVLVQLGADFVRHLVVTIPKNGRPHAHRVDATHALRQILTSHRAGVPVELMPALGCDPRLLNRASQLLKLSLRPDEQVGYEREGRVLLLMGPKVRSLPLEHALRRPRNLTWLPENAELLRALRRPTAALPTVQVVGYPEGADHVALFALDARGTLFRERVERAQLEATLHEYREVLRRADPPTLLSASVHPMLTSLAGRRSDDASAVTLAVHLTARGDQADFEGERFGAGAELPWGALAEAVLSHWPPGTWAHVGVSAVHAPAGTAALTLLAARSRVLRRLSIHLRRISLNLKAA